MDHFEEENSSVYEQELAYLSAEKEALEQEFIQHLVEEGKIKS